ncbi:C3H1-type domain-containing protein [Favolaschia claudopus]|uniref:C3H1-type domain-containing protein n=1 Tax=Favolaschia claudopus TaxID=2862362 RepID=A0AAW0CFA3_9AGAR
MSAADAPWRVKTRPCPFYQQGRCVFEQSCNFVHDVSAPSASSTSRTRLPELLDALRDVLDPTDSGPDSISLVSEHGVSPHIQAEGEEGWTLVNDNSVTKDSLLSPVSLPDLKRLSSLKGDSYSFDSGYGSEFSSPQPLPSTLNLLASPFGSPSTRMSISGSRLFARSPLSPGYTSLASVRDDSPELDSPSTARHGPVTIVTTEEELDDDDDAQYSTAQWTMSPTAVLDLDNPPNRSRFSTSTLALTEDYCSGSESDEEEAEEATAHLAYLISPAVQTCPPEENDTINTLYDVYLRSPPQPPRSSDLEEDRGRIRTRVFTPPPQSRKPDPLESTPPPIPRRSESRSGFPPSAFSDSPEPFPPRSVSSMSHRSPLPSSFRDYASSSSQRETSSPEPPSPAVSTKVPFGFRSESRNSRRSIGPASASAAQSAFSDGAPRRRRISRSVAPPSASSHRSSFFQPDAEPSPPSTVRGLKHLRLSKVLAAPPLASPFPDQASTNSNLQHRAFTVHSASPSISVPSSHSAPIPNNAIPDDDYIRSRHDTIRPAKARHDIEKALRSAPLQSSWPSEPTALENDQQNSDEDSSNNDTTIRRRIPPAPILIPPTHPTSPMRAASALGFAHPATPRPTLLFAIASDDPDVVRRVLEAGEAHATDTAGPAGESALQYTLGNKQLSKRFEIARVLLAFGAQGGSEEASELDDPAMQYYVRRAGEEHAKRSSALIHRSFFRPLTRVRYELVGQDRALEQLFRVLSIHSQQLTTLPVVVLLCGPSGHGKSLLARKFGALLDVPTHTVNMTTLRFAHDLWQAYSMNPYEEPTTCTLAEFLINNEGKRCVVVLDEIEKVEEKTLWPLLMPWESGRCSLEANSRPIDVRNVVWIGTSNVGTAIVSEQHANRDHDELMSREEYLKLMNLVREPVSQHMGASVLSRVTTVLPFVPFTPDEQTAICAEAFHALAGDLIAQLPPERLNALIESALLGYVPSEGARSLYRAVSNQLADL